MKNTKTYKNIFSMNNKKVAFPRLIIIHSFVYKPSSIFIGLVILTDKIKSIIII